MLSYPTPTTREEKLEMLHSITDRLLEKHGKDILAIGAYGSIGLGSEGPYSDIEAHVITKNGVKLKSYEFIYGKFKIELNMAEKDEVFKEAAQVDDGWPIKAGTYINILSVHDPHQLFAELKKVPITVSDESIRHMMREFMIWEPYETVAKIRNNWSNGNHQYLPIGAKDLTWQTAKLIGLANRQFFSTRARTLEESMKMKLKPRGYDDMAKLIMEGALQDTEKVYRLCESLWSGLNNWFDELGIEYIVQELPF